MDNPSTARIYSLKKAIKHKPKGFDRELADKLEAFATCFEKAVNHPSLKNPAIWLRDGNYAPTLEYEIRYTLDAFTGVVLKGGIDACLIELIFDHQQGTSTVTYQPEEPLATNWLSVHQADFIRTTLNVMENGQGDE